MNGGALVRVGVNVYRAGYDEDGGVHAFRLSESQMTQEPEYRVVVALERIAHVLEIAFADKIQAKADAERAKELNERLVVANSNIWTLPVGARVKHALIRSGITEIAEARDIDQKIRNFGKVARRELALAIHQWDSGVRGSHDLDVCSDCRHRRLRP